MSTFARRWSFCFGILLLLTAASKPAAAEERPVTHLDLIPSDATGFVTIRLKDVWNEDVLKEFLKKIEGDPKTAGQFAANVEKTLGAAPGQVDRLTLILDVRSKKGTSGESPLLTVTTLKSLDKTKVLGSIALPEPGSGKPPYAEKKTASGKVYFQGRSSLYFVNANTFVAGGSATLLAYLEKKPEPTKESRFKGAGELISKKPVVFAIDFADFDKEVWNKKPFSQLEGLASLAKAKPAVLTIASGKDSTANLQLTVFQEAAARDAEKAVESVLKQGRKQMATGLKELADMASDPKFKDRSAVEKWAIQQASGFVQALDESLQKAKVTRKGSEVHVSFHARVSSGQVVLMFMLAEELSGTITKVEGKGPGSSK